MKVTYHKQNANLMSVVTDEPKVSVPCDGCVRCCEAASPFLTPDEIMSGKYPLSLGQPDSNILRNDPSAGPVMVMFATKTGGCSMVVDGKCSIYDDRPLACRQFDCRKGHNPNLIEFAKKKFGDNLMPRAS